jgi:hypothetical protein
MGDGDAGRGKIAAETGEPADRAGDRPRTIPASIPAQAQAPYPNRPIRIVIPFGAGGIVAATSVLSSPIRTMKDALDAARVDPAKFNVSGE